MKLAVVFPETLVDDYDDDFICMAANRLD